VRHRIAAISVVLVILIAGGVTIAVAGSGSASTKVSKAQALALIRAVELQPGDFPGGVRYAGEPGSPPEGTEFQQLLHCGHRGKPRGVTVAAERSLLADRYRDWIGEVVASVVIVMPSEALAKAEIATLPSPSGRACMAHDLRSAFLPSGPGAAAYAITITSVPVVHLLGPEAVLFHRLARLQRIRRARPHSRTRRLTPPAKLVYVAEAIFRVGAADIVFDILSERRQFPMATEDRVLALLHSRAEAHKLS